MKKSLFTVILSLIILMNISLFLNTEKVYAASEEALITEWTLPVDADGTTGGGTTIKLPISSNSKNAYTVDWGDGRRQTFDSTAAFPSHTYKNTTETTYTIKVTGIVDTFGYTSTSAPTTSNSYSDYYTFTQYLTGLISWGELEATRYGFSYCQKLSSTIPEPTETSFKNVTSFNYLFYNCAKLNGSIPTELFSNCENVTSFAYTFYNCSNLTGNIAVELFSKCPGVTSFNSTFYNCSNLTGNIASGLFSNCENVTSFAYTFYNCSNLTGNIAVELFSKCPNVTSFTYTFYNCSSLSGNIPEELFATCPDVWSFAYTFFGCQNLTGSIPVGLFTNCQSVYSFQATFSGCKNLTGNIPAELFFNCPNVSTFKSTFNACCNLSGSIPEELFSKVSNVTNFEGTFCHCCGLTGEIPASLFSGHPNVTSFNNTFQECYGLTGSIPGELFSNCSKVKTFKYTFVDCKGLSGNIPGELFSDCSSITTFNYTFQGCSSLNGNIPGELFSNCQNVTDFTGIFIDCKGLSGNVPAELFSNSTGSEWSSAFAGCSGITSVELDVQIIPYGMFSNCNSLTEITISDKLEEISASRNVFTYSGSENNSLPTVLNTTNAIALNYAWSTDKRIIVEDAIGTIEPGEYDSKELVTMWTIPVDADGTTGGGTTIQLPIPSNSKNAYTVNWGDGTVESFNSTADFPTHTYKNTNETIYTIKVAGILEKFGYYGFFWPTISNTYKNYYTFTQYLTGLINWGELEATGYGFAYCQNLSGTIPEPTENSFFNVTTFEYLFNNCYKLSGSIPANLFSNCQNVTSFSNTFYNCSGLNGNIPANLFSNCPNVKSFGYTFYNCYGLDGNISAELFSNCQNVTSFSNTFYYCTGLSGNIPANLFSNCPNVTSFYRTFYCSKINGNIPEELFFYCPNVTDFGGVFGGCSSLTGSIPGKLFSKCPNVTSFGETFFSCANLTGSIPAELFSNCEKVKSFYGTFGDCHNLSGSIPAELFSKTPDVTSFGYTFQRCYDLTGDIPGELFANCPNVTNFSCTFDMCQNVSGISGPLFANCPNVTSFYATFSSCYNLGGKIDAQFFASNVGITSNTSTSSGYAGTFRQTSITELELDTRFVGYQMFYGCSKLTKITISDKLEGIYGTSGAFYYYGSNPQYLPTSLDTTNSIALAYNWLTDKRVLDINYNTTFNISSTTYTYDGTEKKPQVTDVIRNGEALVEGTDYVVSYKNNITAGTATIFIEGIGKYANVMQIGNFTILPKDLLVTAKDQTITYGDSISTDASMVMAETLADGHTVSSITLTPSIVNVGAGTITPSEVAVEEDVYDVTHNYVITYVDGTLTILPYDIANATISAIADQPHTGSAITPLPVATVPIPNGSTTTLVKDTDYTVAYSNNTNVGTATVTLTGKGNYTGTKSANFIIIDITAPTGTFSPTGTAYTNDANYTVKISVTASDENGIKKVVISGTCEGTDLAKDGVYNNATGAYEATFKLSDVCDVSNDGVGEYTFDADIFDTSDNVCEVGTYVVTYESILGDLTITATNYSSEYDGSSHGISLSGSDLTDATIVYGTSAGNYNLTEEPKYANAGEYTIYYKVSKRRYNDYEGSAKVIITPKKVKINWDSLELQYNGKAQTPTAAIDSGINGETIVLSVTGSGTDLGTYVVRAKLERVDGGQANVNNYILEKNAGALNP